MNNFFNFQHRLYHWNWKLQNSGFSTLPQGRGMYADNQGKILYKLLKLKEDFDKIKQNILTILNGVILCLKLLAHY